MENSTPVFPYAIALGFGLILAVDCVFLDSGA
jgi:hypothetical protein